MKDVIKRLARLEGCIGAAQAPSSRPTAIMQVAILAVHHGNYQPHEAIAHAHARALGYDSFEHYKSEIASINDGQWLERHNSIWTDLCTEHGVNDCSPMSAQTEFLVRMLTQLPNYVLRMLEIKIAAAQVVGPKPL